MQTYFQQFNENKEITEICTNTDTDWFKKGTDLWILINHQN